MNRAILLACFAMIMADRGFGDDTTVENAPPVVVKTIPQSGAVNVDPATKEIVVVFAKEMTDGSWSWSTAGKNNYPGSTGKPSYRADKRSCVLPVKLEPGKDYAIWVNSAKFNNFKDASGKSAVPYLLVFRTKK